MSLRRVGKQGNKWRKARAKWFKLYSSEHYKCYICGRFLFNYQVTLDHIESRSRHPELRYEMSNLAPCCYKCNHSKGSLSLEQYRAKLQLRREEREFGA